MKIVGDRLRTLRMNVPLSLTRLGKIFGVGQTRIFKYEQGEATVPAEIILNMRISLTYPWIFCTEEQTILTECTIPARRWRSKNLIRRWTGLSKCALNRGLP